MDFIYKEEGLTTNNSVHCTYLPELQNSRRIRYFTRFEQDSRYYGTMRCGVTIYSTRTILEAFVRKQILSFSLWGHLN
jgi:hypothetical protein